MGIMLLYQASRPQATIWSKVSVNFGLPYFTISTSLNVIITLIISVRLLMYRRRMRKAFPSGSPGFDITHYTSIVSMLVESSALYAVVSLLFIGFYGAKSHLLNIFLPILSQVQIIAPLLIILRVANQRAWTASTATAAMTPLEFGDALERDKGSHVASSNRTNTEQPMQFLQPAKDSELDHSLTTTSSVV